jgi:hypothetical protein
MAGVADLKAKWERDAPRGRSMLRPLIKHRVTGPDFKKQLALLAEITSDSRFDDALEALAECELVDSQGNWCRDLGDRACWSLEMEDIRDHIFLRLERAIKSGSSLKLACAEIAALGVRGHSFEAVCKELERLWRGYRRNGDTEETVVRRISETEAFFRIRAEIRSRRAARSKL